jgi:hypothetical protein
MMPSPAYSGERGLPGRMRSGEGSLGVGSKRDSCHTLVGIMDDDAGVNQAVSNLRRIGITADNLTVVLKRGDPDHPEPFPEGTRYIVVPDDNRGLELAIGVAVLFVISGLLFAFTTPAIGASLFLFFIALASILVVGSFSKVGVMPILIDIEAPAEESGFWNEEFENGKVLLFASAADRRTLESAWEVLQAQGVHFDVVGRRLEPQPVNEAVLHRAKPGGSDRRVKEIQEA